MANSSPPEWNWDFAHVCVLETRGGIALTFPPQKTGQPLTHVHTCALAWRAQGAANGNRHELVCKGLTNESLHLLGAGRLFIHCTTSCPLNLFSIHSSLSFYLTQTHTNIAGMLSRVFYCDADVHLQSVLKLQGESRCFVAFKE